MVELGACTTFADAAAYLESLDGECILAKALGSAASTPLRNRITMGGSTALFPVWSDLVGPLIALGAEVELTGTNPGLFPVARYVDEKELNAYHRPAVQDGFVDVTLLSGDPYFCRSPGLYAHPFVQKKGL